MSLVVLLHIVIYKYVGRPLDTSHRMFVFLKSFSVECWNRGEFRCGEFTAIEHVALMTQVASTDSIVADGGALLVIAGDSRDGFMG